MPAKACGAVVYLRAVLPDDVLCNIVAAKTKVAPISMKTLTVPRLELKGCLLLSKLFKSILQSLYMVYTISELFCWADSYDCVHWINNKRKIRERFIQGRVEEIRRNLPDIKWLHYPGKLNPADLPSRGFVKGDTIDTWLHGPMFLSRDRDAWPCVKLINNGNDVDEVNESRLVHIVETKSQEGSKCDMKKLINIERCSSLQKLMRITCYVLKFIHKLKNKMNVTKPTSIVSDEIQSNELENAKLLWIKNEQRDIINNYKRMKELKYSLGLFTDPNGVLRLKGRLESMEEKFEKRFPIFLDQNSYFTKLIILECHKKVKHSRVKDTLNELRSNYWITQGRRTVKRIIGKCTLCNRFDAKAFESLPFAPLPEFRVKADFPFTSTGIDYFGPLLVKNIFSSDNSENDLHKVHVVLYTCASSRAVYLD